MLAIQHEQSRFFGPADASDAPAYARDVQLVSPVPARAAGGMGVEGVRLAQPTPPSCTVPGVH